MKLYALLIAAIFAAVIAVEGNNAKLANRPTPELDAERMGILFLEYRTAVASFQRQNPAFTGSVPAPSLAAIGYQFPQDFLQRAGNAITGTGTNAKVITSYGSLPAGSGRQAQTASENDASIGFVSGPSWTSYSSGVSMPLAIPVSNGAVVSVIQIGN